MEGRTEEGPKTRCFYGPWCQSASSHQVERTGRDKLKEFEIIGQCTRLGGMGLILALLGGCSLSSLRCGTDGESSYVDLTNVPQDMSSSSRYYAELCSFAYVDDELVAKLTIIEGAL